MSEKRKGHFDPRNLETYQSLQRVKGAKDGNKGMTPFVLTISFRQHQAAKRQI